jgi:hypothetical protein
MLLIVDENLLEMRLVDMEDTLDRAIKAIQTNQDRKLQEDKANRVSNFLNFMKIQITMAEQCIKSDVLQPDVDIHT